MSVVRVPAHHPPETKDSSFINGINVDKLHNFVSEMNEEPSINEDKLDSFTKHFPSQPSFVEKKKPDTDASFLRDETHSDEGSSLSDTEKEINDLVLVTHRDSDEDSTKSESDNEENVEPEVASSDELNPTPAPTPAPGFFSSAANGLSKALSNVRSALFSGTPSRLLFSNSGIDFSVDMPTSQTVDAHTIELLCERYKIYVDVQKCVILARGVDIHSGEQWRISDNVEDIEITGRNHFECLFPVKLLMSTLEGNHHYGEDIFLSTCGFLYKNKQRITISVTDFVKDIYKNVTGIDFNEELRLSWLAPGATLTEIQTLAISNINSDRSVPFLGNPYPLIALKIHGRDSSPERTMVEPPDWNIETALSRESNYFQNTINTNLGRASRIIDPTRNRIHQADEIQIGIWSLLNTSSFIGDRISPSDAEDDGMENRLSAAGHHLLAAFQSIPQDPSLHEATDHILDSLAIVPQAITFSINKIGEIFRNLVEDTTDVAGNDGIRDTGN